MKTLGKLALVASVIAGLGAATVAQAHGIWFAQRSNQLALIYGVGAEDLDAVKRLPKVKTVAAYDENGKEVPTQLAPNGPLLVVNTDNQPAIVAAILDNGPWCKTPDGKWHNKGKDEVPDAKISEPPSVHRTPLAGSSCCRPCLPANKLSDRCPPKQLAEQMARPSTVRVLYVRQSPCRAPASQPDYVTAPTPNR